MSHTHDLVCPAFEMAISKHRSTGELVNVQVRLAIFDRVMKWGTCQTEKGCGTDT